MSNDLFVNWKFSGLKTDEEKQFKLPSNKDVLKPLDFSENSFFILSYFIKHLCRIGNQEDRDNEKNKLLKQILKLIPVNEINTFNKILDYFTNGNKGRLYADSKFVDLDVIIKTKHKNFLHTFKNTSSLQDISKDKIEKAVKHDITIRNKDIILETLNSLSEEDLYNYIEIKDYCFEISVLPNDFSALPVNNIRRLYDIELINSIDYLPLIFKDILDTIDNENNLKSTVTKNKIKIEDNIFNSFMDKNKEKFIIENIIDSSSTNSSNNLLDFEKESPKYDDYNLFDFLLESNKDDDVNKSDNVKEDNLISIKNNKSQIDVMFNFEEDGQLSFAI